MYDKLCKVCGCSFKGKGPAAMYCEVHQAEAKQKQKERKRLAIAAARAASGEIKMPGVGKGGNPMKGKANPMYKHGKYVFETLRTEIKREVRYCQRCNKDLLETTQHLWVVHHRDHNHWNHDLSNLELLCKRCHQIEHECHKAFTKSATTIP